MNTPPSTLAAYRTLRLFAAAGWLGVSVIVAATSVALLRYRGPFTLLNLTISELGLLPDSPAAGIFTRVSSAAAHVWPCFSSGLAGNSAG